MQRELAYIQRLRRIVGPSAAEAFFLRLYMALYGASSIAFGGLAARIWGATEALVPRLVLELPAALLYAVAAYKCWERLHLRLHFNRGTLSCIGPRGSILWKEDLNGLTSVEDVYEFRGNGRVRLRWPDRERMLPFQDWRRDWLLEPTLPAIHERDGEEAARRADIGDIRRTPWDCPDCAAENPATFDMCWNCSKIRQRPSV